MREKIDGLIERLIGGISGVGVWVKHRIKATIEPISPAMIVLSIAAGVGAFSAVVAVLAAREYHRK